MISWRRTRRDSIAPLRGADAGIRTTRFGTGCRPRTAIRTPDPGSGGAGPNGDGGENASCVQPVRNHRHTLPAAQVRGAPGVPPHTRGARIRDRVSSRFPRPARRPRRQPATRPLRLIPSRARGEARRRSHSGRGARSGHPRSDRERAPQRAPRDGRGALPIGDVAGHPRAARRVPDDHRPAGPDDRRAVRLLRVRDAGRAGVRARAGRHHPAERPLQVRRRDQPHQRLDGADTDLLRGRADGLQLDVRPHDGRRRTGARQHADRRDPRSSARGSASRRSRSTRAASRTRRPSPS